MFHSSVLLCTSRLLPVVPAVAKVASTPFIIQVLSINPRTVAIISTILVELFTINLVSSVY